MFYLIRSKDNYVTILCPHCHQWQPATSRNIYTVTCTVCKQTYVLRNLLHSLTLQDGAKYQEWSMAMKGEVPCKRLQVQA